MRSVAWQVSSAAAQAYRSVDASPAGPVAVGRRCHTDQMSTDDQRKGSEIHGEAVQIARDEVPQELLDRLAAAAGGNDRLRTITAGEIAGAWMANSAGHQGHELVAAGLLLAGVVDGDELLDAVRTGYERGRASLAGYDPSGISGA